MCFSIPETSKFGNRPEPWNSSNFWNWESRIP